jgi:hypothetical protein
MRRIELIDLDISSVCVEKNFASLRQLQRQVSFEKHIEVFSLNSTHGKALAIVSLCLGE